MSIYRMVILASCTIVGGWLVAGAPAEAGGGCVWQIQQTINTDPDPKDVKDESSVHTVLHVSTGGTYVWELDRYLAPAEYRGVWCWRYKLDADAWEISADCRADTWSYGFSSVSDSLSGAGQWVITRISSCCTPTEDIEVNVRQQFHAEAELNADEKCEVRGVLKFWCTKTKSTHNPPAAINSVAKGGVSIDCNYDDEDTTVGVEFAGLSFNLVASSGGSDTADPEGHDAGNQGTTPETINTSTNVGMTMDLDSWDDCQGKIKDVWWNVTVDCTCLGCCKNVQRVMTKNTYPSTPPPGGN
ncbi:MAG: hypothetical protein P1V36_07965 [Planctomycetota bacterium]|nr:hypothetical protein [Planctomycetota bacterium]